MEITVNQKSPLYNWGNIYIILIFFVASFFIGCAKDNDSQDNPPPVGVEQEIGKLSFTRSQKGKTKWKLDAKSASIMESGQIKIKDVNLVVFDDKSNKTVDIHSEKGELNQSTYDVKMIGNVKGTLSDGGYMTADEVYWSENQKKLYTLPGVRVTIVYKGSTVIGEELDARPQRETVELQNVIGTTYEEGK
jgi:LPS export ABC transporter protein LptC